MYGVHPYNFLALKKQYTQYAGPSEVSCPAIGEQLTKLLAPRVECPRDTSIALPLGTCEKSTLYESNFHTRSIPHNIYEGGAIAIKDCLIYVLSGHMDNITFFEAYTMEGEFVKIVSTFGQLPDEYLSDYKWHKLASFPQETDFI